jgi:hypothetical protein
MFVKHLQEYLEQFTDGKRGNAISNAKIYMEVNGHLEEVKRIEVQESNMIGQSAIRVVLKPTKQQLIIAPKTPE